MWLPWALLSAATPVAHPAATAVRDVPDLVGSGHRRVVAGLLPCVAGRARVAGGTERQAETASDHRAHPVWLKEPMNWHVLLGVLMMTAGSVVVWYRSAPA